MKNKLANAVFAALLILAAAPTGADTEALLDQAIQDYEANDLEAAKSKLLGVLEAEPENRFALYYLGVVHYLQGDAEAAIPLLEQVSHGPEAIEGAEAFLASVYLASGKPERALPYYAEQHAANPEDEAIAFSYASSLKGVGRTDEAAELFRRQIEGGGAYADAARYELGDLLSQLGAHVSAAELFRSVDPGSPYADSAQAYVEALARFTRPVGLYGSVEYFYDDNPASSGSQLIPGVPVEAEPGIVRSQGVTVLAMLNTRSFEFTHRLQTKLGYMFYGTFHHKKGARDYDFIGHYVNPSVSYRLRPSLAVELKGDFQFLYYNQQRLSTNFGAKLTASWTHEGNHSINLHAGFLKQSYTESYRSDGFPSTTLEYLNAWTPSVGLGGTLFYGWGGNLMFDYTFYDERTTHRNAPVLGPSASDNRFRKHEVRLDLSQPFPRPLSRLSVVGNVLYSHRDFPNRQSGAVYPSVAGRHFDVDLVTGGGKLELLLWKPADLKLAIGAERTVSDSRATELDYDRDRYFFQLSAAY